MRPIMAVATVALCLASAACGGGTKSNTADADASQTVEATTTNAQDKAQLIRQAVQNQMTEYPLSTLRDLYKNFFQDFFGPGHLLSDTAAAGNYLRSELKSAKRFPKPYYEPTGYLGNLYRVNLKVITEGLVPYDVFFDAFVRSMNKITMMPLDEWKVEWRGIEDVIDSMSLNLPDYDADKAYIQSVLDSGKYAIDHSEVYEKTYEPHYRIIEKDIFKSELLPLIEKR